MVRSRSSTAIPNGNLSVSEEWNPNGSYQCIEGITSPDGRILGKMGHNERCWSDTGVNIYGNQDMQLLSLCGVFQIKWTPALQGRNRPDRRNLPRSIFCVIENSWNSHHTKRYILLCHRKYQLWYKFYHWRKCQKTLNKKLFSGNKSVLSCQ